jgi:hypothetical protein
MVFDVALATPKNEQTSGVADATRTNGCPGVERRAKFMPTLRVEEVDKGRTKNIQSSVSRTDR